MTWELVHIFRAGIDEPAEGAELEWAGRAFHGEELTPAAGATPASPASVSLSQSYCDRDTLVVRVAATGRALVVLDRTGEPTPGFPAPGEVVVRGEDGPAGDETRLYFHPSLAGQQIWADYQYYAAGAAPHGFVVVAGTLAFALAGGGKWFRVEGDAAVPAGVVKVGEAEGVVAAVAGEAAEVWALTAPSSLLARWARAFSGYVDVAGVELSGLEFLGALAQATDARVGCDAAGRFIFAGEGGLAPEAPVTIPWGGVYSVTSAPAPPGSVRVELNYRGGKVAAGPEAGVRYIFRNELITSQGHAQIICDRLAARLAAARSALTVVVKSDYYLGPGAVVSLALGSAKAARTYRVLAARRFLTEDKVELALMELTEGRVYELE